MRQGHKSWSCWKLPCQSFSRTQPQQRTPLRARPALTPHPHSAGRHEAGPWPRGRAGGQAPGRLQAASKPLVAALRPPPSLSQPIPGGPSPVRLLPQACGWRWRPRGGAGASFEPAARRCPPASQRPATSMGNTESVLRGAAGPGKCGDSSALPLRLPSSPLSPSLPVLSPLAAIIPAL